MTLSILSPYLEPILAACLLFPVVAALFTLPFLVVNYRKYGGVAVMRVLVVYSFILYAMCAFLLVILPLPSREAVARMAPKPIGLIPFRALYTGMYKAGFRLSEPSSFVSGAVWQTFLTSRDLFQIVANIVMQIPLGVYLRYYFRCNGRKTLVIGLCVSLFFELTQLSGLFFIYPQAYRFADVDDLIANTLGAMIGYWIAPLLCRPLPTRDEIDRISYSKGSRLTLMRRVLAAIIDLLLMGVLAAGSAALSETIRPVRSTLLIFLLCFVLIPRLTGGRTAGHALLRIRVVQQDGVTPPTLWQLLIRYSLLLFVEPFIAFWALLACAFIVFALASSSFSAAEELIAVTGCGLFLLLCAWFFLRSERRWNTFPHGHLSRTTVVQTPRRQMAATQKADEP